jgi:hypothetical protein
MTEQPKLHVVGETPSGTSVFDDLDALRKTPKIKVARKSVIVNIDVGRPPSDCYFRAHPDPEWRLEEEAIVKAKDSDTVFYINPYSGMASHPKLKDRVRKVTLAAIAIWPANTVRIWPVPVLGQTKIELSLGNLRARPSSYPSKRGSRCPGPKKCGTTPSRLRRGTLTSPCGRPSIRSGRS